MSDQSWASIVSDYITAFKGNDDAVLEVLQFATILRYKIRKTRKEEGISVDDLAKRFDVDPLALEQMEAMDVTEIVNMLKTLHPLGYTLAIVPLGGEQHEKIKEEYKSVCPQKKVRNMDNYLD